MARVVRFAFDIGTNSIGWAVLEGWRDDRGPLLEQGGGVELRDILGAGVRIFSDGRNPKDGASLAAMRRGPRAARRRRDRFKQRQRKVVGLLAAYGLLPSDKAARMRLYAGKGVVDPYALRARGLTERLEPHDIGRALFHLNQRRGFKSNRKTDGGEKERGPLKAATKRLEEALEASGKKTLGAYLHEQMSKGGGARFRHSEDPKLVYDIYPTRALAESEFDALWTAQSPHYPHLMTEDARRDIREAIFHQRPLKPVKAGKCTFIPEEERAPKALPSVQAREIYETLNHLRYGEGVTRDTALTLQQRDLLATKLLEGKDWTFDQIRRGLKLPAEVRFNLEETRDKIKGADTARRLSSEKAFGKTWRGFDLALQDAIVEAWLAEEDEDRLVARLTAEHGLDVEKARDIANAALPEGHSRLGRTANARILAQLRMGVVKYSEACERAGFHHSDFRDGVVYDHLPPYQVILERHTSFGTGEPGDPLDKRLGRVANPTVHIGLNQLRRVANKLVATYGQPDEIVVELARELKLNAEQKKRRQKENNDNKKNNTARRELLEQLKIPENGDTMFRLRLWQEQKACGGGVALCPYSLEPIPVEKLFTGDVDIDHILPVSRTLDDSPANKIVCYRDANRGKRNRSPHEAFGASPRWPEIEANAAKLPRNKSWRFGPDAMKQYDQNAGFLDRQLNETAHLGRMARSYLGALTPQTWVVTGRLTALLRGKWGLNRVLGDDNRKNRDDHRHHAVDAIAIGCTSRSLLNMVAKVASRAEEQDLDRLFEGFPEPMPGFVEKARNVVRAVIVSHKPEHGKGGALHEDTAYGIVSAECTDDLAIGNVVCRKALAALTLNDAAKVRDERLRERFVAMKDAANGDEKAFRASLRQWAADDAAAISARTGRPRQPMRHVRLLKPEASATPIADRRTGEPYKALVPGENWCVDIVQMRDGTWKGFAATIFEASRKDWRPVWERERMGGKLVMRLHKGDLVEIDDKDGTRAIKRVVRLNPSNNRVWLAGHNEGGDLMGRHDDPDDAFRWDFATFSSMRERGAKRVCVDEMGCCPQA